MPNIGPMEILWLALLGLMLFGPKRLPEIGRSLGSALRELRDSLGGIQADADPGVSLPFAGLAEASPDHHPDPS